MTQSLPDWNLISVASGWRLGMWISMSDSDEAPDCPICQRHSEQDSLNSQQVVFLGYKALLDNDDQLVETLYGELTPYDGHIAISLLLLAINDIALMMGVPTSILVQRYRENLAMAQRGDLS